MKKLEKLEVKKLSLKQMNVVYGATVSTTGGVTTNTGGSFDSDQGGDGGALDSDVPPRQELELQA
jgi:hypothetical protein